MANNTIIQQGRFTSAGTVTELTVRSDIDFMHVYNYTQASAQQAAGRGVEFYWQRGMATDTGIEYRKTNNTDALNMVNLAAGGFTLLDTSEPVIGAANASVTGVTNAAIPLVTMTNTAGVTEDITVRLYNIVGAQQLGAIDFTADTIVANTSIRLAYMDQVVAAANPGTLRTVSRDPKFYPRRRFITALAQVGATNTCEAVLSVIHDYNVGERVRVIVPDAYGMTQMNGLTGTIIAANQGGVLNDITLDIDVSTFDAFAFPLTAAAPFSPAMIVPIGETATDTYANLLDDATENLALIGMSLATGIHAPAGSNADVIYWTAGKSFSVTNV